MSKFTLLSLALVALASCSHEETPPAAPKSTAKVPATLRLDQAPPAALSVIEMRKSAANGADVVVTGRAKDFVATKAVFTIADLSLKSCADRGDKMECDTPWDYCCADPKSVTEGTAAIQVLDGAEIATGSLQGWNGLDHLKPVVVHGKLEKDDKGNLTVVADGIYVQS